MVSLKHCQHCTFHYVRQWKGYDVHECRYYGDEISEISFCRVLNDRMNRQDRVRGARSRLPWGR